VSQFLEHIYDLADVIAARSKDMAPETADDYIERELARQAVIAKAFAERNETPDLAVEFGFRINALVGERVATLRQAR